MDSVVVENGRFSLPAEDLADIVKTVGPLWERLRDTTTFITGGTGFFGQWLLESFAAANDLFGLNARVVVLTRDPQRAELRSRRREPLSGVEYLRGDIRSFALESVSCDWLIHGAAEASAKLNSESPQEMISTVVDGTRRILGLLKSGDVRAMLMISSGAVYGRQPSDIYGVDETFRGGPDIEDPSQAYAEAKRLAELLLAIESQMSQWSLRVARCFAFVGPYLPLDTHFAIGNFIRDAMNGGPIDIAGDGTPARSYLYGSDLAIWLWTLLLDERANGAYNVGSEHPISIEELANLIAAKSRTPINVVRRGQPIESRPGLRYVPSTRRAQTELDLSERISLAEAVDRTMRWYEIQWKVEAT